MRCINRTTRIFLSEDYTVEKPMVTLEERFMLQLTEKDKQWLQGIKISTKVLLNG